MSEGILNFKVKKKKHKNNPDDRIKAYIKCSKSFSEPTIYTRPEHRAFCSYIYLSLSLLKQVLPSVSQRQHSVKQKKITKALYHIVAPH